MRDNENSFGDPIGPDSERPIKCAVPAKPLNQIEHELKALMYEEIDHCGLPQIWIEDGEFANADEWRAIFGESLTIKEAMLTRNFRLGHICERYALPLLIARELGKEATLELYRLQCGLEKVDPIL